MTFESHKTNNHEKHPCRSDQFFHESDHIASPRQLRSEAADYEGELTVVIGKRCPT